MGKKRQLATDIGRAVIDGGLRHRTFADVERFCLFVGFPRSGTTLVGTLLNAHPDVVIAQELDALRYVRFGVRARPALFDDPAPRWEFAATGFQWTGYDYTVPGQYQGRYQQLQVIGDKRAGMTTNRLRDRPELIDVLRRTVRVPLRVIHVVRSPFDTTATMARRRQCDLSFAISHYARLAVTVDQVRNELAPGELLDFRYEELTANPQEQLRQLCEFHRCTCRSFVPPGLRRASPRGRLPQPRGDPLVGRRPQSSREPDCAASGARRLHHEHVAVTRRLSRDRRRPCAGNPAFEDTVNFRLLAGPSLGFSTSRATHPWSAVQPMGELAETPVQRRPCQDSKEYPASTGREAIIVSTAALWASDHEMVVAPPPAPAIDRGGCGLGVARRRFHSDERTDVANRRSGSAVKSS